MGRFSEDAVWATIDGVGDGQYGDWRSRRLLVICCADGYERVKGKKWTEAM